MIVLLGGAEIAFILVIIFVLMAGSVDLIINMIAPLVVIFIIKNFIQTVVVGYFKNKNSLLYTILFFLVDIARSVIFFNSLRSAAIRFDNASGLNYFLAVIMIFLYLVIGGGVFLLGELSSLTQAFGKNRLSNGMTLASSVGFVILLLFCVFLFLS